MRMHQFVMVCCGGGRGGGRCLESMVGNVSCTMGVKVELVEIDGIGATQLNIEMKYLGC